MDIDAVVLEKINNDTDFQNSLVDLSDEDKDNAINTKKSELIKAEFENLSKKAQENEQKFNDQRTRAEKAEELAKKARKEEKKDDRTDGLTAKDVLILTGAGYTHEEDIETIEKWAKFNGVSIKDALQDSTLKTVLSTKSEERRTAQATATKAGARGTSTPSSDVLIEEARKGKLDENNLDKLAEARMAKRREQLGK